MEEAAVFNNDWLRNPNYRGFKRAKVVGNVDAVNQSHIKVYIPELMATSPMQEEDEFGDPLDASARIENYMVAYPSFEYWSDGSSNRGNHKIPKIGTWLFVFFESEDPRKCIYTPWSVNLDDGKALNAPHTSVLDDLDNPVSRVNIDMIRNDEDGFIIERNSNPQTNSFVIKTPNGMKILIHDNVVTQRMKLMTNSGHTLELVDKSGDWSVNEGDSDDNKSVGETFIRLITNKGNSFVMDDTTDDMRVKINRHINITAGKDINIIGGQNMTVKIADAITVNAGKDITVNTKGSLKVEAAGSITMKAGGVFNLQSGNTFNIKAGGVFKVSAPSYSFA